MLDLFRGKKEEVGLLINIGNGSITLATAFFGDERPKFLFSSRHHFVVLEKPNAKILEESVMRTLEQALSEFEIKGYDSKYWDYKEKRISRILIVFSSPWFKPKIKHIQISKETSFVITERFLADILKKEEEVFQEELRQESEKEGESYDIIEKSIVNIKINGYILNKNIGKTTKNFEAYLRMSEVSKSFLDKVRNIVDKHTHLSQENIIVHTFPFVSFLVSRDIFSENSSFILLDVTGEVTDMTLVLNNSIAAATSFPTGRNYIVRQIADVFNSTFELAESTLRLYIEKKLDDQSVKKVKDILDKIEREWAVYFENSLLDLSPQMVLPGKFIMTADSDVSEIYKGFISLSKTDTTSSIRKNMSLTYIGQETLSGFYENNSTSQVSEFAAILAIFYNRIRMEKLSNS
jgi:hypothetical protein